jgi:alpha/beta superfamily hydrolase
MLILPINLKLERQQLVRFGAAALASLTMAFTGVSAWAQEPAKVVDIPTRPGVTQRFLYLGQPNPIASVIVFAGGNGGLQITAGGSMQGGSGNFLVRSRQLFADAGFAVAVIDAPSDRQSPPYLGGYRQTPEHQADVLAVIAWLRQRSPAPVWLVGTSRGTQSAAYIATEASPAQGGPDGLVLTSTILTDDRTRAVPKMPVDQLTIPVLVVHHEQDGCRLCAPNDLPLLMDKLGKNPKAALIMIKGGQSTGDPCEARAYHGFNGIEAEVVGKIGAWVVGAKR